MAQRASNDHASKCNPYDFESHYQNAWQKSSQQHSYIEIHSGRHSRQHCFSLWEIISHNIGTIRFKPVSVIFCSVFIKILAYCTVQKAQGAPKVFMFFPGRFHQDSSRSIFFGDIMFFDLSEDDCDVGEREDGEWVGTSGKPVEWWYWSISSITKKKVYFSVHCRSCICVSCVCLCFVCV